MRRPDKFDFYRWRNSVLYWGNPVAIAKDLRYRRPFRPGRFYLDHGDEPMILIELTKDDTLRGIRLRDGQEVHSDLYHCGPEPVTEEEAKAKLAES